MKLMLAFFFSVILVAQEIEVSFTRSNNLAIRSNNCSELLDVNEALCSWKESLKEEALNSNPQCKKSSAGVKKVIVSSCLPQFIKKHHGKKLYGHGANCWGTALSFKNISKKPRFVWSKEMIYWLNSPLCRKLNVGEKKKPGDIINIYGPEYKFNVDEKTKGDAFWDALFPGRNLEASLVEGYTGFHHFLHSETFITKDLFFGKDSPNKYDRFTFHSSNETYGRPKNKDCQERQDMSPRFREYGKKPIKNLDDHKCKYFSLAYRCQDFMNFFEKEILTSFDRKILDEIKEIQEKQKMLFSMVIAKRKNISKKEIKNLVKAADKTSADTLKVFQSKRVLSKLSEMLLTLKYFSVEGIRKSIELVDLIPPTERL